MTFLSYKVVLCAKYHVRCSVLLLASYVNDRKPFDFVVNGKQCKRLFEINSQKIRNGPLASKNCSVAYTGAGRGT